MAGSAGKRAEELFLAAIERPAPSRSSFLEAACAGEPGLRAEVEMLVACHDAAGDFLEHLPSGPARVFDDVDALLLRTPERIGKFRIVRQLGSGGMGCVYLAECDEPRREVALKLIRAGLATPDLVRRFRHEVQVVALLQHPGIAQLYEAGAEQTPTGALPYFAMEPVDGCPITEHAAANGLAYTERMRLLARVAEAVHYAHQKGVIHRDLKPANILVDRSGRPKVLDFGVARLTGPEPGTVQTAHGQLVGTLAYMSPEQLAGDPSAVDARSDIYALGVILYELLARRPAYELKEMPLTESMRAIRETSPPRLREADRRLAGDPEVVVEKAMAKDPAQRYPSAQELAADIERLLADQPIMARRPSGAYQLRKFAKRNRALVILGAALLVTLVGGLVVLEWKTRVAEKARWEAEENLVTANRINAFIENLFDAAAPNNAKKSDLTVREAMGASSVERIRLEYPDNPRLRVALNGTIGRTYKALSLFDGAAAHLEEAASIAMTDLPVASPERLRALQDLGHLYKLLDRFDEGERLLREALRTQEAIHGRRSREVIECRNDLAALLLRRGEAVHASEMFQESLNDSRRLFGDSDKTTLVSMNNLAAALNRAGKTDGAISTRRRLLELCLQTLGEEDIGTLTAMSNLGKDLADAGRYEEGERVLRRALAGRLAVQGPLNLSTLNTMCNLGACLVKGGHVREGVALLENVVCVSGDLLPEGNTDRARYDREYAIGLIAAGEHARAEPVLLRSYWAFARAMGEQSDEAQRTLGVMTGLKPERDHWE